jgi:hypothetical protein
MKYEKPKVAPVASAAEAILSGLKPTGSVLDNPGYHSIMAYEADE